MFNNFFTRKLCLLCDNVEKYGIARQARDDNVIVWTRFACWITNVTYTHSAYVILNDFLQQKWLSEFTSMLRLCIHYLYCLESEYLLNKS